MQVRMIEIRDIRTFIPAIVVKLGSHTEEGRYLLSRANFGKTIPEQEKYFLMIDMVSMICNYDPNRWNDRTKKTAHQHVINNWHRIHSGEVVDVEFILGEKDKPVRSEHDA